MQSYLAAWGLRVDLVKRATARKAAFMAPRFTRAQQSRRLCGANLPHLVPRREPSRRTVVRQHFQESIHPGRSHEGLWRQRFALCLVLRGLIPIRLRRRVRAAFEAHKLICASYLHQCVERVRHWVEKLLIGIIDSLQKFH